LTLHSPEDSAVRAAHFWIFAGLTACSLAGSAAWADQPGAAGVPGDPKKPARVIEIDMSEGDGKMSYAPDHLVVKPGEQIRFVIHNKGALAHEFRVGTPADNRAHAEMMRAMPGMHHAERNQRSLEPAQTSELHWRFSRAGTFEFACLIPGHREAGMHGAIVVE
jgi:uncharacterized cupredoxin-like copper-binding protein